MAFTHAGRYGTDSFVNRHGRPLPAGTAVTVYLADTTTLATLWVDRDRSAEAPNPAQIGDLGNFSFYADADDYDLLIDGTTIRVSAAPDPDDLAAGGGPPGPHASTHASAGSDPVTPAAIGAATAAQGATADTAVQPADLDVALAEYVPITDVGLLPGERNMGVWDSTTTYEPGDVVHTFNQDGGSYLCIATSTNDPPFSSPTKWTTTTLMGSGDEQRQITLGPGASTEVGGTAIGQRARGVGRAVGIGPRALALGEKSLAIGDSARASGQEAAAVGPTTVADGESSGAYGSAAYTDADYATVIGFNQYEGRTGGVNLGGLLTGVVTPNTNVVTAAELPGGFVDGPATLEPSNPAPGSLRLIFRAAGLFVRDSAGTEVKLATAADVDAIVGAAPGALNTLIELAAALGNDPNFAATMVTALAGKQPLHATLTALAGVATTAFGRNLLALADAAALRAAAGLGTAATSNVGDFATPASVTALAAATETALGETRLPGGAAYRPTNMDSFYLALAAKATTPVDVVALGDSITEQDAFDGARAWAYHLEARLNGKVPVSTRADGTRKAQIVAGIPGATTTSGAATNDTFGGRGVNMTNGLTLTFATTMDGFSIVYDKAPGFGSIEIRDGVGGTLLDTIVTTGAAKSGYIWTSGALSSAVHTIEVKSVGTNRVGIGYPHNGNRASGVRLWNGSRGGRTTDWFTANPARGLDFIEINQPDLVILSTGTNDASAALYDSRMRALVAAVRNVYAGPIALWIPPISASAGYFTEAATVLARAIAADLDLGVIDAATAVGRLDIANTRWGAIGPHPNGPALRYLGDFAAGILAGDPIGLSYRLNDVHVQTWYGGGTITVAAAGSPAVTLAGAGGSTGQLTNTGITWGPSAAMDTVIGRSDVPGIPTIAVGSPLSLFFSVADGVAWCGRRQSYNPIATTAYTTVLADVAKIITRTNGSASTHKWPQDSAAAIPVGSVIEVLNLGAGTVVHSADTGATLVTGSATSQVQGKQFTGHKVAANTWLIVASA